jgi:putative ABC transport system permease protein
MDTLAQDVRYSLRRLLRSPGFTLVAILTLALGIGANSAIFSVVNGVLLRPLPFGDAERLVLLYTAYPDDEIRYPLSAPDFMSIHDDSRSFTGVAGIVPARETLTGGEEPITIEAARVTERFFEVLGVSPLIGRTFAVEENRPGADAVALLSHAHWRLRYGSDPGVIGRTLMLNGIPRTVVGVLPPEVDFPGGREVYYPLAYDETFSSTTAQGRRGEFLRVIGRLAPGVDPATATAELLAITERLRIEFPETNSANITFTGIPLREHLLGNARAPLLILLGAVGLVLLIACVNVANLLLARAAAREGEMAVRSALGAGRGRLVRQLLTESTILGVLGGGAGLALAVVGTQALVAASPEGIPRLETVRVNATVVAFTFMVAVGTGLLFGMIPAAQVARSQLAGSIRKGGRGGTAGSAANRVRASLIVVEMALAVMLLVGAALLIRSFAQITAVDPGFRSDRLVTFRVSLPATAYAGAEEIRNFYPELLERVAGLPGVETVAAGTVVPMSGAGGVFGFDIENREPPPDGFVQDASGVSVTPGFFRTLGVPLFAGRLPDERDVVGAPEVMVVNQAFARRYFPDEEPIGRRISLGGDEWIEIVGVVGDVPQGSPADGTRPAMYVPLAQFTQRTFQVVVRTSGEPLALAGAFRREVAALDPQLPVQQITTGEQLVSTAVAQPRFYTALLALFAGVALTLSAIGIYGVMSFLVAQRTREIGVRVALGAAPGRVLSLIIRGALRLALLGIGIGIAGALVGTRILAGLLYGVGTLDPIAFVGAAGVLLGAAALAGYLPARAATRVDPAIALRSE